MAFIISDKTYKHCTAPHSVSSDFAKNPTTTPGHIAEKLYGGNHPSTDELPPIHEWKPASKEDIARAHACGNWGTAEPSELFLQCFHDALCSLEDDSLAGMVSPSLMGSTGTIPLSIIAPLPDIARHMSNLIVRAEREVFLATNFWIASDAATLITDALLELSRRAGQRGVRIVVKIMYDRGNIKQVMDNHQIMTVAQYTGAAVKLPSPSEIPNIDMEVQNFHRPMLGTFHSKFMVVDRRIAIVQSNNIQDNDNLEMMTQLEGPIVDSLYDTSLLAWERELRPALPCMDIPAMNARWSTFDDPSFQAMFQKNDMPPDSPMQSGHNGNGNAPLPIHAPGDPHYDPDIASEMKRLQSNLTPASGETQMEPITRHFNLSTHQSTQGNAPDCSASDQMTPLVPHAPHAAFPIALVNRAPYGAPNNSSVIVPQNFAWLSAIRHAKRSVFIQTPNLNATALIPALLDAVRRGVEVTYYVCLGYNDSGELLPGQGGTNEMIAAKLYSELSGPKDVEAKEKLKIYYYVGKDQTQPIHNKFHGRSCHIKVLIADGHVGIQGNGNMDTQSWCHSMEVNIMIDSEVVCKGWMEGLRRNQNTHIYGLSSAEDGIWRSANGQEAAGAIGKDPGRFSWAKGIVGAVQRVRGVKPGEDDKTEGDDRK